MSDEDRKQDEASEAKEPVEEPAAEPEGPAPETEEPDLAAEEPELTAEEPPPSFEDVNVFDLLRAMIPLFVQEAWVALGLQARPGASDVAMDLRCARVAIDTTQMLIDKLGDEASPEERREFDQVMTTLRVNFMRRQAKSEE